ncbi:hypothetical protein ACRALDRAFT_212841 [Sodiomyces alcalophilus JCM 7366]|uniref:uncharacterized protein n=1 Tax=Sodiomyces alcalophilus JCM 7366 TaxID=591952 RepID=UPI0039B543C2
MALTPRILVLVPVQVHFRQGNQVGLEKRDRAVDRTPGADVSQSNVGWGWWKGKNEVLKAAIPIKYGVKVAAVAVAACTKYLIARRVESTSMQGYTYVVGMYVHCTPCCTLYVLALLGTLYVVHKLGTGYRALQGGLGGLGAPLDSRFLLHPVSPHPARSRTVTLYSVIVLRMYNVPVPVPVTPNKLSSPLAQANHSAMSSAFADNECGSSDEETKREICRGKNAPPKSISELWPEITYGIHRVRNIAVVICQVRGGQVRLHLPTVLQQRNRPIILHYAPSIRRYERERDLMVQSGDQGGRQPYFRKGVQFVHTQQYARRVLNQAGVAQRPKFTE